MLITKLALATILAGAQGPNPSSQFDWTIATGEVLTFNTVSQTIVSTPPQFVQTAVNGFVDVRNFTIEQGGLLVVQGPNPMVLCASGQVTLDGKLVVNGGNNPGVLSLNSTNLPEPGAPGQGGGGKGGTGSPLTTMSSPRGGDGFGAFGSPSGGGQGGETGWSLSPATAERRGAGGGGGALGRNQTTFLIGVGPLDQSRIGLDGEAGFSNKSADNGALSGPGPAFGGAVGSRPFADPSQRNDFFGTMIVSVGGGSAEQRIHGELRTPWAGAGGGAGGDANRPKLSSTFPGAWSINGDEKGAGGGGGGGSIRILSLGPIVFGPQGEVTANGGNGGGGENTLFLNRVGGGSGGGSGGHIILETAAHIDLSQVLGGALRARGGQGGAGSVDKGGATVGTLGGSNQTQPRDDACPDGYPTSGPNACLGHIDGAGGDGGPGIIQLHTPRGLRDIDTGLGRTLADVSEPRPLCWDGGCRMLVSFGASGADASAVRSASDLLGARARALESLRVSPAR